MHELHKLPEGLAEKDRKNNSHIHFHIRTQLEGEIITMPSLCIAFLCLEHLGKSLLLLWRLPTKSSYRLSWEGVVYFSKQAMDFFLLQMSK